MNRANAPQVRYAENDRNAVGRHDSRPGSLFADDHGIGARRFVATAPVGEKNPGAVNLFHGDDAVESVPGGDPGDVRSPRVVDEAVNDPRAFGKKVGAENLHTSAFLRRSIAEAMSSGIPTENSSLLPLAG